jgi:NAD(P)-dependent dehydrogenase (short-subunit alcohol dehydrogenase family)
MTDSEYSITVNPADSLARIGRWIEKLPDGARQIATPIIGDEVVNLMRQYEAYSYVSRAQAYPNAPAGPGWFSEKQRRYVMAAIRRGEISIPYARTQALANGWQRVGVRIVNTTSYAKYVQGDNTQSRHEALVGWKTVSQKVEANQQKIMAAARNAVRTAVRKLAKELGVTYG